MATAVAMTNAINKTVAIIIFQSFGQELHRRLMRHSGETNVSSGLERDHCWTAATFLLQRFPVRAGRALGGSQI
jgi:hypothetical protein